MRAFLLTSAVTLFNSSMGVSGPILILLPIPDVALAMPFEAVGGARGVRAGSTVSLFFPFFFFPFLP
jgi:hypothetical protein